MRHLSVFVVLVVLGGGFTAEAVSNAKVVCGISLNTPGDLAWEIVKENQAKASYEVDDLAGVKNAIWQLVKERSGDWPDEVKKPVLNQFRLLLIKDFARADFVITTLPSSNLDDLVRNGKQYLFPNTDNRLEVPRTKDGPLCQGNALYARVEAAYLAKLIRDAVDETRDRLLPEVVKRVGGFEATYDKYLFEGFPMFPWETLVNSWLLTEKRIAEGPPRNQIVFLHPAAGIIGSDASRSDTEIAPVLSIEPLGIIRYSANYEHYYGLSVLATFPTDRDLGVGFALNYDAFKLGVTWHEDNDGPHDGPAVFFGIDLYHFASDTLKKYGGFKRKGMRRVNGSENSAPSRQ